MDGEERKNSGVARECANEQISVSWEPEYCIHTANCLNAEPDVFDAMRRPWIKVDAATADRVAAGILTVDVKRWVGFRKAGFLRFGEGFDEINSASLHLRQDVVRCAVQDAVHGAQAIAGGGFMNDAQDWDSAGNAGFETNWQIAGNGEGE